MIPRLGHGSGPSTFAFLGIVRRALCSFLVGLASLELEQERLSSETTVAFAERFAHCATLLLCLWFFLVGF